MSTVVPSSLRLIRELNSGTKIELPKMRVFLGCKTAKYKMVFCISQWKSVQTLSSMKKKNIEICSPVSPVQLCNYRLLHDPLEFYKSLTGVSSEQQKLSGWSNALDEKWEVRSEELYSFVVWTYRTPPPSKVHSQCSFTIYSNFQTLKCLINLVFLFV